MNESSLYIVTLWLTGTPPIWRHSGGGTLMNESSLYIVRVRTLRLDKGWLIAIFSNVLPKVQRSRSISPDSVAKWRHPAYAPMTHRCLPEKVLPNDVRVQRSLWVRTGHFLTTDLNLSIVPSSVEQSSSQPSPRLISIFVSLSCTSLSDLTLPVSYIWSRITWASELL